MKSVILATFLVDEVPHARVLLADSMVGERFYDIGEVSIFYNGRIIVLWPAGEEVNLRKETDG